MRLGSVAKCRYGSARPPGKLNLYVGKTPVKFNLPEAGAVERLVELIKDHGKWEVG